jgi:3'-phosphoadenosine 5'-phosphosulfate sulfotransferase (PAPS reductase)/FAD synthetase
MRFQNSWRTLCLVTEGDELKLEDYLVYVDTFAKINSILDEYKNKEIRLSYSGGSDSDTVAWLLRYLGYNIKFVFYDTGLEYQATRKHLDYMKSEGFDIEVVRPKKTIPNTIYHYGVPFISKHVSDMMQRLNHNKFDWKNDGNLDFDSALNKYPHSKSALRWWTDNNNSPRNNISWNRGLKEFLIKNNGIPFPTSAHCCYNTKKLPSKQHAHANNIELLMLGIRRAEGGKRATAYSSCFIPKSIYPYALFFPIFWWTNEDKILFDEILNIKHSDCYGVYGMKRTGCPGCPFGQHFEEEILSIAQFEPKLEKAVSKIFGQSYEWTRKYKEFQEETKPPRKNGKKIQKDDIKT